MVEDMLILCVIDSETNALYYHHRYPIFTMLGQSLASILVGFECLFRATPDIYCDTMGAAFVYPVAKMFAGCRVVAYVHYPIISSV